VAARISDSLISAGLIYGLEEHQAKKIETNRIIVTPVLKRFEVNEALPHRSPGHEFTTFDQLRVEFGDTKTLMVCYGFPLSALVSCPITDTPLEAHRLDACQQRVDPRRAGGDFAPEYVEGFGVGA
jgi:hypothetical protein